MLSNYISGAADGSGYNVSISFVGDNWTEALQAGFVRAADYISSIVTGDIADETRNFGDGQGTRTIDDLELKATLAEIDGRGSTLGYAGPTFIRPDGYFPVKGEMTFDFPDARAYAEDDARDDSDTWETLILHEMLHSMGFGTVWNDLGLIKDFGTSSEANYRFTGTQARHEYEVLYPGQFLDDPDTDKGVAVESNLGGPGTIGGHWDEATFGSELMTGLLNSNAEISNLTIAALDDMGYETTYIASEVVCFARGTLLTTDFCQMAVEDLAVGDQVETLDNGLQTIRWIGARDLDAVDLARYPNLLPIKISAGCLGFGTPQRDLFVSPQHRMFIASDIAKRLFDSSEILVAAKDLLGLDGVETVTVSAVEYFHILFDEHQLVFANGAVTESLYTGPCALKALPPKSVKEIFTLFPDLRQTDTPPIAARPLVTKKGQISKLLNMHAQSHLPLIDTAYH